MSRSASVRLLIAAFSLVFAGCLYRPLPQPGPDTTPQKASDVERAADQGMTDYRIAAADVCASLSGRVESFQSWDEFAKTLSSEMTAARLKSFAPFDEAVNARLFVRNPDGSWKTDGPLESERTKAVLADAERGLRGETKPPRASE